MQNCFFGESSLKKNVLQCDVTAVETRDKFGAVYCVTPRPVLEENANNLRIVVTTREVRRASLSFTSHTSYRYFICLRL